MVGFGFLVFAISFFSTGQLLAVVFRALLLFSDLKKQPVLQNLSQKPGYFLFGRDFRIFHKEFRQRKVKKALYFAAVQVFDKIRDRAELPHDGCCPLAEGLCRCFVSLSGLDYQQIQWNLEGLQGGFVAFFFVQIVTVLCFVKALSGFCRLKACRNGIRCFSVFSPKLCEDGSHFKIN